MKQPIFTLSLALTLCATVAKADVVLSFPEDQPSSIAWYYDLNGESVSGMITPDEGGTTVFPTAEIPDNTILSFMVNGKIYGAIARKGENTNLSIGNGTAKPGGDNAALSDFLTNINEGFSYLKFKPGPSNPFDFNEWKGALDEALRLGSDKLREVPERDRKWAGALMEGLYANRMFTVYQMDAYENKTDRTRELNEILESINPESDAARHSGLLQTWISYSPTAKAAKQKGTNQSSLDAIDALIKNQANRNALYSTEILYGLMACNGDVARMEAFLENATPHLTYAPELLKSAKSQIDQVKNQTQDGMPLPCDPVIIRPDGTKTTLCAEIKGKTAYVDLWATWCAPCCREIPFMDKLHEKYEDRENLVLISISCDDDLEAWKRKLTKDNPAWPQFVFDKASGNEFMNALNATGIPRFFLIGPDEKFISVNAPRPSLPEASELIDKSI